MAVFLLSREMKVFAKLKEVVISAAEKLRIEGREEGIQRGILKGMQQGMQQGIKEEK